MKRLLATVLSFILCAALAAAVDAKPAAEPLLPQRFSEWQKTAPKTSADAAQADAAHGDVLREYNFTDLETATYTKPGRTLRLKAARFRDKSGAYGAFTFYKAADMITQQIGDQASANGEHVLFYKGNVLVDAQFDRVNAMSAAELRELAEALPQTEGEAQIPPTLPTYFPKQSYVKNSVKYVLGPAGLSAVGSPVTADVVEFSKAPEIAIAKYATSTGEATLTLIAYPTPQIAAQRLRSIEGELNSDPDKRNARNNYAAKRTGPIVAIVTGAIPDGEAKSLLASINYEAEVTWNERTKFGPRDNPVVLVWAAMRLAGWLTLFMLGLGLAYGIFRLWALRYWPEREHASDMIRLDLRSREPETLPQALPPGPAK